MKNECCEFCKKTLDEMINPSPRDLKFAEMRCDDCFCHKQEVIAGVGFGNPTQQLEDIMTDMFGEGGKEEVKEAHESMQKETESTDWEEQVDIFVKAEQPSLIKVLIKLLLASKVRELDKKYNSKFEEILKEEREKVIQWCKDNGLLKEEVLLCPSQYSEKIRETLKQELIEKIEGMGFKDPNEAGQFALHADGYNQALEEVIELLKEVIK